MSFMATTPTTPTPTPAEQEVAATIKGVLLGIVQNGSNGANTVLDAIRELRAWIAAGLI